MTVTASARRLLCPLVVGAAALLSSTAGSAAGVEVRLPGAPKVQRLYGASHALVIGASRYTAGWSELPGVRGDVAAVSQVLRAQGFEVETLMDPTRVQLDEGLRRFANSRGLLPNNRLLVYFAGHGHTLTTGLGKKLGYIVPVDAPRPDRDESGFRRLAYSMENFEQLSRQIESKHVLFLFDSCFSGTVFRSRSGVPEAISDKTDKPVRQFITAGDENQPVPDESIFRRQFERALGADAEADLNRDGYITGSELGSYLEDQVTNYSRRSQTPRWGKLNDPDLDRGDFVFVSVRPPAAAARITAPLVGPGQSAGMSLEDLQREDQVRQEWTLWQRAMAADFGKVGAFSGSADLQVRAWERFLAQYDKDNPQSQDDEGLRQAARERLDQARRAAQAAASSFVAAAPAPPAVLQQPVPSPAGLGAITLIVPFAAGGPTDYLGRQLAESLKTQLGQAVTVENVGGAGGNLGAVKVARAAPDGRTLLLHHLGMATSAALYRNPGFRAQDDFEPLGLVSEFPLTLVGRPTLPANSFKELQSWVRGIGAATGSASSISWANAGLGSASHLCALMLQQSLGAQAVSVPYRGTAPAVSDLIGGQVDLYCDSTVNTSAQITAGRLKAFASTSMQRLASRGLEHLPTLAELGLGSSSMTVWHGLYAPKGTSPAMLERLNAALRAAIRDPRFLQSQASLGALVVQDERGTRPGHRRWLEAEQARWTPLIRAAGVFAD